MFETKKDEDNNNNSMENISFFKEVDIPEKLELLQIRSDLLIRLNIKLKNIYKKTRNKTNFIYSFKFFDKIHFIIAYKIYNSFSEDDNYIEIKNFLEKIHLINEELKTNIKDIENKLSDINKHYDKKELRKKLNNLKKK